jgi:succinate dehydrogenase / fumarate reductase, iron-sulfur subunit
MARNIKLRIWRGDSTDGGLKDVVVEANEGEVVLDVIHRVQATQMGDLAVRWNCKAGKCGCLFNGDQRKATSCMYDTGCIIW